MTVKSWAMRTGPSYPVRMPSRMGCGVPGAIMEWYPTARPGLVASNTLAAACGAVCLVQATILAICSVQPILVTYVSGGLKISWMSTSRSWEDDVAAFLELLDVASTIIATTEKVLRDAGTGLTATEWDVLAIAHACGSCCPSEILRRVALTNRAQTLSSILDRLETQGHVSRRPHPKDGRGVLVEVTPRGRHTIEQVFPIIAQAVIRPFTGSYTDEDIATLRALLARTRSGRWADTLPTRP